jgi:hypothetical protein
MLLLLIGLPCFIWATLRLLRHMAAGTRLISEDTWINRLAVVAFANTMLFTLLAVPVIFSFARHPMLFMCQ